MCNINELSEKSEKILSNTNQIITISGATIVEAEKEMEDIEEKAKNNMEKLSLLL